MSFETIVDSLLPEKVRYNKTHPEYNELRIVVSSMLVGIPLVLLFPLLLIYLGKPYAGFLVNEALMVVTLLSIRFWGHYRVPMAITALVTYYIIYGWIEGTGLIYSVNNSILHMYLLAAIWADKKYGWWAIFSNLAIFYFIYRQTLHSGIAVANSPMDGPLYPLVMNCLITVFFGGFLAYQQYDQERDRAKIRALQDQKITRLDEAVKQRTRELNSMRENIATDFHDETGNMLAAISRQASLLQSKLRHDPESQSIARNIVKNSDSLSAISKDFMWHLNYNSDDPGELFDHLTGYGQAYYNQFDLAFSATADDCQIKQFDPMAAVNIIFIFKEAMTNVVKHAEASEVRLHMACRPETIVYSLEDDGRWKDADCSEDHYGLANMKRRCQRNNFGFAVIKKSVGTKIEITVPAEENKRA